MKLFYERIETENEIKVIFKPYSMYLLLLVLVLLMAVSFVDALSQYEYLASVLLPIAAVVVGARIVLMHKVNKEVQQAMRDETVSISGGKLSTKNPLNFVISKGHKTNTP